MVVDGIVDENVNGERIFWLSGFTRLVLLALIKNKVLPVCT